MAILLRSRKATIEVAAPLNGRSMYVKYENLNKEIIKVILKFFD